MYEVMQGLLTRRDLSSLYGLLLKSLVLFIFFLLILPSKVVSADLNQEHNWWNAFWEAEVSELTAAEEKRLLSGEVLVHREKLTVPKRGEIIFFRTTVLIKAPVSDTWSCLKELDNLYKFQPNLKRSKVLESKDNFFWVEMAISVWPLEINYVNRFQIKEADKVILFELDQSRPHDFTDAFGFWRITSQNKDTILEYGNYVNPGRMVPQWLYLRLTEKYLPDIPAMVKRRVESGCLWNQWKSDKQE